jgi:hypothetical protein
MAQDINAQVTVEVVAQGQEVDKADEQSQ